MPKTITVKVFRCDPDTDTKPYFKEYVVATEDQLSVLILLERIQQETDRSLSFRSYCCGLQMCRSCLMKINHKKKLACLTLVKPGETVLVEPASYPDFHVKDLVVKDNTMEVLEC